MESSYNVVTVTALAEKRTQMQPSQKEKPALLEVSASAGPQPAQQFDNQQSVVKNPAVVSQGAVFNPFGSVGVVRTPEYQQPQTLDGDWVLPLGALIVGFACIAKLLRSI
jgi:hypothetical protein